MVSTIRGKRWAPLAGELCFEKRGHMHCIIFVVMINAPIVVYLRRLSFRHYDGLLFTSIIPALLRVMKQYAFGQLR